MNYEDVNEARRQAQETLRLANIATRQAAELIAGRLRVSEIYTSTLRKLKKELQQFNAVTGEWK